MGFILISLLFAVPIRTLPTITLLVTLLIPVDATQLPLILQGTALGIIPLAVWLIRAHSLRPPSYFRILAGLLGTWLILATVLAPIHTNRGWAWLATATIGLIVVFANPPDGLNPKQFRALFLTVTTVLAGYGWLEGFLLHDNVLFHALYDHTTWWRGQQSGVSYRITTLLGHPLINGTIFAAAAVLAASELVEHRRKSWPAPFYSYRSGSCDTLAWRSHRSWRWRHTSARL
jgi:hypothetical protein